VSDLSFDLTAIATARAQLATVSGRMRERLDTLRTELDQLDWSGADRAEFDERRARWEAVASNLHAILEALAHTLAVAADRFAEMDAEMDAEHD
jgi:WXG100 family type VII secretion target